MYKLSKYNYSFEQNGKIIIFNLYTQALAELDEDAYRDLIELNKEARYKENYIRLGYWVDFDEQEEVLQKNKEAFYDDKILHVVLRMTDACNFRCPYCYQEHEKTFLDSEKRDSIKKFLKERANGKEKVYVHFFGGEPLLNLEGILDIDSYLRQLDIDYNASITTNAYLLNSDVVEKLCNTNITKFQITLDGPAEIHNQTRVLSNGGATFDIILGNIKSILTITNADIVVRFNCGKKNKEYAKNLLQILCEENILQNDRVKILFQQLHNYSKIEDKETYYTGEEYFSVLLELMKMLIQYGKPVYKFGPVYNTCVLYQENAYVIGPDLELEACTSNEKKIGVLQKDGSIRYNSNYDEKILYAKPDNKCKDCILLPMCMSGCPYKRSRGINTCLMQKKDLKSYILLRLEELQHEKMA